MHHSVYMQRVFSLAGMLFSILDTEIHEILLQFPRDIERLVVCGLEIPVVRKTNLTLHAAARYLCALRGNIHSPILGFTDRALYGLLHVGPPCNIIFIREDLPFHIRNYVLAHELGHFLADVFSLQQLWEKTLPEQAEVIRRVFAWNLYDPDLELRGLLKGLPERPKPIIGRGQNLMLETVEREISADLIAREIIAPWQEVSQRFEGCQRNDFIALLHQDYGLPLKIAAYYHGDLERALAPSPDVVTRLFSSLLK